MSPEIETALRLLTAGELVGIPTETVYGLAADASNETAVRKIFAAKGRPADHPLIVHLASVTQLSRWAREIPPLAEKLAAAFWPGPMTLILKRQPWVLDAVTGGQDTVGIRIPSHPLAHELLAAFGGTDARGLAAPSANRFGHISPTTAQHVREELGNSVAMVLDGGPCTVGLESTIIDLSRGTPVILRPGHITASDVARVAGLLGEQHQGDNKPRVSGSLAAHYAPDTRLNIVASGELNTAIDNALARHEYVAVLARHNPTRTDDRLLWQQCSQDAQHYARDLYAHLRLLDASPATLILVEALPEDEAWIAAHDRLGRAATGSGKHTS